MGSIFDDDLDEKTSTVESEPGPKRKSVWDMPSIAERKKAMEPRLLYQSNFISANSSYLMNQWNPKRYEIQEDIVRLKNPEDGSKTSLSVIRKRETDLAKHHEEAVGLNGQIDEVGKIGNDKILLENLWYEQREAGPNARIAGASLPEVTADRDAFNEAVAAIPVLNRKLRRAFRKAGYRSAEEMIADVPAQRELAAARFWKNMRLGGFPLVKPKRAGRNIPRMMMTGDYISGIGNIDTSVDPLAFLAAVFPEKFDAAVKCKIIDFCEAQGVTETSEARAELDELRKALRQAEVTEESQIRAHDKIGVFLPRRQDANLQIVFDYRKK